MKKAWKVVSWSLKALFQGKFPETNYDGSPWPVNSWHAKMANQPLAGGYCGVVVVSFLDASCM